MISEVSNETLHVTFGVKKHLLDAFDQVAEQTQISRAALLRMAMGDVVKAGIVREK